MNSPENASFSLELKIALLAVVGIAVALLFQFGLHLSDSHEFCPFLPIV